MGQHDVQMGQCRAIFNTVDSEGGEADSESSTIIGELEALVSAAHHPQLVAALQSLRSDAFEPQIQSAQRSLSSASGVGHEVLGVMNQGDQQMSSQSAGAQGQVPGQLDVPGAGGGGSR